MDFLHPRTGRMAKKKSLSRLRDEAAGCRRCDLWKRATQTVFGEGPSSARLMLVGEQPGDQEDLAGEPFVGPAGQLLREALDAAGLDPAEVFLTNAVKHFQVAAARQAQNSRATQSRRGAGMPDVAR